MAIGEILGGVGSLAGGIFGAIGDEQAASQYRKAARYEQGAAVLTSQQYFPQASAIWLKMQQTMHQVYGAIGTQASQVGAGNFKMAGSAKALQSSSMRQGATAIAAEATQGQEDMHNLMAQSWGQAQQIEMDKDMAKKEQTAAMGSMVGGVLGAAGGIFKGIGAATAADSGSDVA
jgi:hypothetical protein